MAKKKEKKYLAPNQYYDIKNPPLILQGFPVQSITGAGAIAENQYTLKTNRGVVSRIDYLALNLAIAFGAYDEANWNDAFLNLRAGGQDLIQNVPAERFDYNLDQGKPVSQRLHTWLRGGQVLNSKLERSTTGSPTVANISTQLLCEYSTEDLEEFRKNFKFKKGTGLKMRSYRLEHGAVAGPFELEKTLPKNQGNIVGVELLYMGASNYEATLELSIDGINIIEGVNGLRFSRYYQRSPRFLPVPLHPGADFKLVVDNPNTSVNAGVIFLSFYFDN